MTDDLRRQVETYVSFGIPQEQICKILKLSDKTLTKYFQHEIDTAEAKMIATLASTGYQKAMGFPARYDAAGNLIRKERPPDGDMIKFLLCTRGRWRTTDPPIPPGGSENKLVIEVVGGFVKPPET